MIPGIHAAEPGRNRLARSGRGKAERNLSESILHLREAGTEVSRLAVVVTTPITSVVPGSVRKAVVTLGTQLIPFGRVLDAQLGRCLSSESEQ